MKGKRWLAIICFFLLLCASLCFGNVHTANSYEVTAEEDFLWEIIGNNEVRILGTELSQAAIEIVIPEKIDGKDVVEIGEDAFLGYENLKSVMIPKTVRYIGRDAFSFSYSMNEVIVAEENLNYRSENGVLYSKDKSELCYVPSTLTGEFVIPWEVNTIRMAAFYSCNRLESVYFSHNVNGKSSASSMGENFNGMLSECTRLKEIRVEEGHTLYRSRDGVLLSHDGKTLLAIPNAYDAREYVVPDGVEVLDTKSIAFCRNIESIILPDSIRKLDEMAFYGCLSLREITIPEGVRRLTNRTIFGCHELERIVIPNSVVWAEKNFVESCEQLTVIEAGGREEEIWEALQAGTDWERGTQKVKYIWEVTSDGEVVITGTKFYETVTELEIPETIDGKKVVGIEENVFSDNLFLEKVFIPYTIVSLPGRTFFEAVALKEIKVASDNPAYADIGGVLYDKEISRLIWVPDTYEGVFRIPETVKNVSANAFWKCTKLEEIYIPAGMDIGIDVENPLTSVNPFHNCGSLRRIEVDEDHALYRSEDGILYSKDGTVLHIVPLAYEKSTVTIPEKVEEIAGFAFAYCGKIEKVVVPEGLRAIGEMAFVSCIGLKEISIPEGIKEIRQFTFWGCEALKGISLPVSVKHVAEYAFSVNTADNITYEGNRGKELIAAIKDQRAWDYILAEPEAVVLKNQLWGDEKTDLFVYTLIDHNSIVIEGLTESARGNRELREVVIPDIINGALVVGIAEGAFAGVPLTSVVLPSGLQEIGRGAFYGCNLKCVTIPKYVCYIAPRAFGANYVLERIGVEAGNETYISYFGCLYTLDKAILLQVPANYEYNRFVVPESVEIIEEYAFGNNRNIKTIQRKKEGIEIREKAFWNMLSYEE